jgi:uncharacterized membrane protein YkoI
MMTSRPRSCLPACVLTILLTLASAAAVADRGRGGGSDSEGLSAEQAAAVVSRTYGGRVVSVKSEGSNDKRVYKVRVLLDGGRVKTVRVDSRGNVSDSN